MAEKNKCVVIGGTSGIGAAFTEKVTADYAEVYVIGLGDPLVTRENVTAIELDLSRDDLSEFYKVIDECDTLIITAGIGRVDYFENLPVPEIEKTIAINFTNTVKLLKRFYGKLLSGENTYCLTMGSLAGEISSPLFSIYGATKAALNRFTESVNIELECRGSSNRITNVMPISFRGSSFNGGLTDTDALSQLADECLEKMYEHAASYIPDYEETCRGILERYHANPHKFGLSSFEYKIAGNRISTRKMYRVGYIQGDFTYVGLREIEVLRNARAQCDRLVVGVLANHSDTLACDSLSFSDRFEYLSAIRYVTECVLVSVPLTQAWDENDYDVLFIAETCEGFESHSDDEVELLTKQGVRIVKI